jgi:hypothetical protein
MLNACCILIQLKFKIAIYQSQCVTLCHFAVFRRLSSSYKSPYCYIHLHIICPKQVKCNRLCCLGFDDMSLSNCFLDILNCFFEISGLIYPALPHHIPEKVSSATFPRKLQDWQVRWRLCYVRKERPVVTFKFFTVVFVSNISDNYKNVFHCHQYSTQTTFQKSSHGGWIR